MRINKHNCIRLFELIAETGTGRNVCRTSPFDLGRATATVPIGSLGDATEAPRCERCEEIHKARCCNHLRLLNITSNGQLGQPNMTDELRVMRGKLRYTPTHAEQQEPMKSARRAKSLGWLRMALYTVHGQLHGQFQPIRRCHDREVLSNSVMALGRGKPR
jgi:hypothetical protein